MPNLKEKTYDALMFDLDGTLWDAASASARAWSHVAQERGLSLSITEDVIRAVSGLPFEQCVRPIFGDLADDPKLHAELDLAERAEIEGRGGAFYEGMSDFLTAWSKRWSIFVISNCQPWYLQAYLRHANLGPVIREARCLGLPENTKAANIRGLIERHGFSSALYVGDTHWDQRAAGDAGADFIWAKYGFGKAEGDVLAVGSLRELDAWLSLRDGRDRRS